jgi:hypothetical protein
MFRNSLLRKSHHTKSGATVSIRRMPLLTITECSQEPDKSAPGGDHGNSSADGPFFQAIDWLSFGAVTVAAFGVYLCTIAPEVTLEDGGTFVTGAVYAGVPDCPGFPLWTVYSWLFVKLIPFSNDAWRVTVGSALAAALACGLTALMVSCGGVMLMENGPGLKGLQPMEQNILRAVCGCVAGLALALSEPIWSQVAVLNVWALSTLLFAAMLTLLMRWTVSPHRRGFLYAAVFVFGLLLTNSQFLIAAAPAVMLCVILIDSELGRELFLLTAVLGLIELKTGLLLEFNSYLYRNVPLVIAFVPAAIWAIAGGIKARRVGSEWKSALLCGFFFLAGLAPYFYSALASMTNPPLNWAYPRTVEGFYHLVSRGQYDKLNPTRDLGLFMSQLAWVFEGARKQFGWLYFIFIPLPLCLLRRVPRVVRQWMMGLTAAFACTGPMMVAMLNPTRDRATVQVCEPFFSVMYVVLAIWAGLGLMIVGVAVTKPQLPRHVA